MASPVGGLLVEAVEDCEGVDRFSVGDERVDGLGLVRPTQRNTAHDPLILGHVQHPPSDAPVVVPGALGAGVETAGLGGRSRFWMNMPVSRKLMQSSDLSMVKIRPTGASKNL